MRTEHPIATDIVLLGGGHSHVAVLKSFGMRPLPGVRLTLVTRDLDTPYSGMLPGLLAGHYTHGETHVDLQRLARFAGARVYHTAGTGIDTARRLVRCDGRPDVAYDLLSIDIGSTPRRAEITGADRFAIPVKPVDGFLVRWRQTEEALVAAGGGRLVVVGGGAGGVELSLSLRHRLVARRGVDPGRLQVTVLTDEARPLPGHADTVRRRMTAALGRHGIELMTRTTALAFEDGVLHCAGGLELPYDCAVLVTGAAAAGWLAETGLLLDEAGFIRVDRTLQSLSHPGVFACGDIASIDGLKLPKSGVYAVREGPVLADNLRRLADGKPLRPYKPQARTLALISTGEPRAIASYGNLAAEGAWVWQLKDWIDRRWMKKYQELPEMDAGEGPRDAAGEPIAMRCGGCGAKVASPVLRRVLERLQPQAGEGALIALDEADDAAVFAPPPGKLLVQTVDQFRAFIDDPYLFGRIAANHCLGDLYAMGAAPHAALALVTLPYAEEAKLEQDLYLLLSGALGVLAEAGVMLAGGHTAEGAELAFGLSLNGWAEPAALTRKAGLAPGEVLLLTKPLGTGALFAADMQAKATGADIAVALGHMQQSSGPASAILREHGARACTDVTGFGLAGHLIEMLKAGDVSARIDLDLLPSLPGAQALLNDGIASSLQPANAAFAAMIDGAVSHPAFPLLFDPQTAGGLLAGVPARQAEACLTALRAAGYLQACAIGEVASGMPGQIEIAAPAIEARAAE